jgi:hypothetical protein
MNGVGSILLWGGKGVSAVEKRENEHKTGVRGNSRRLAKALLEREPTLAKGNPSWRAK